MTEAEAITKIYELCQSSWKIVSFSLGAMTVSLLIIAMSLLAIALKRK